MRSSVLVPEQEYVHSVYTHDGIYEAKDLMLRTDEPRIELPIGEMFRAIDE